MSSQGLVPGLQWNQQLDKELNDTSFGIIVVTPWNQHSQWLNYEAGALAKRVGGAESRVAPLLIDFPNVAQLSGPLSSFQVVVPTKVGLSGLVTSINASLGDQARKIDALVKAFEVCWPSLESALAIIGREYTDESDPSKAPTKQPAPYDDDDMLSEILKSVRSLERSDSSLRNEIRSARSISDVVSQPRTGGSEFRGASAQAKVVLANMKVAGVPVVDVREMTPGHLTVETTELLSKAMRDVATGCFDWDATGVSSLTFQIPDPFGL